MNPPEVMPEDLKSSVLQNKYIICSCYLENNVAFLRKVLKSENTVLISWIRQTYFTDDRGVPFKVDLVSDAKCHDKVLGGGVPKFSWEI